MPISTSYNLLLQSGDDLLLQNGSVLLLQAQTYANVVKKEIKLRDRRVTEGQRDRRVIVYRRKNKRNG